MSQKVHPGARNIGARFRSARALVPNMNRKDFCERHGLNRYTMQSWENGLHVSKGKNVEKFIDALAKEGVFCSAEWLIDGLGEAARAFTDQASLAAPNISAQNDDFLILFKYLEEKHKDKKLSFFELNDSSMLPHFEPGDKVIAYKVNDPEELRTPKLCIAEISPERKLIRKTLYYKDSYLLLAANGKDSPINLSINTAIFIVFWHFLQQ